MTTSRNNQEKQKSNSIFGKGANFDKLVAVISIILVFVSVCIGVFACILTISVPEIRNLLGFKDNTQPIQVVIPTEIAQPTPTLGPCENFIDVQFSAAPQFLQAPMTDWFPDPPSGEYMLLSVEYKNLQSQPIEAFYWDQTLKVAGQFNTTDGDFVYFSAHNLASGAYQSNHSGGACPDRLNPGLWNTCYMVFDIDPALKNMFLVIQNEFGYYANSCTMNWKIP